MEAPSPLPLPSSSWADVAAYKLIAGMLAAGEADGQEKALLLKGIVQEVARQMADQIPPEMYDQMALELARGVRRDAQSRLAEDPLEFTALGDEDSDDEVDDGSVREEDDSSVAIGFDGGDDVLDMEDAKLSATLRHVPSVVGNWLAADLHRSLTASRGGYSEAPSPTKWMPKESSSLGSLSTPLITPISTASSQSDTASDAGSTSPSIADVASPPRVGAAGLAGQAQPDYHRQFYEDDTNVNLALDAFKKFEIVLVTGRGLRVIKHNHNGGRNDRILQYNPQSESLYWETSRMMGSATIAISSIERVSRETTVVYIWYNKSTGKKVHKTAVGFETPREYDARVLQLALMHLMKRAKEREER
jgi:hypothetical protein